MNITIAIADSNREYLTRLSEVLQEYEDLSVSIFTSVERLEESLRSKKFDVILFNPDICEEKLQFPNVKLSVCLYCDEVENKELYADSEKVMKYQRISNLYKEILKLYADKAGYTVNFDNSQNTRVIAMYSPMGGSGKTTIALAVANKIVSRGKSVLFLSMEQLNSSVCVNPHVEDGITVLIESISEDVNFELKLKGGMQQGLGGISYVDGFERIVDYNTVTQKEIMDVINSIKRCGICDVVIIDMHSRLDEISIGIFEQADNIIVVEKTGEMSDLKMNLFSQQAIAQEYENKMLVITNMQDGVTGNRGYLNAPNIGHVRNYGKMPIRDLVQLISTNEQLQLDKFIN